MRNCTRVIGNAGSWIKLIALAVVCGSVAFNQVQATPTVYGSAYTGPGGAATLYNIDPNTGAATSIGAIGFNQVGGIDFNSSGILYGVGKRVSDGVQVLLQINPTTGAGTQVGATTLSTDVQDISFRNSDGALFGYSGGNLYTFSIATGAATLVGNVGDGFPTGNGLAFSPFDTLYKADNIALRTINQSNGSSTIATLLTYSNAFDRVNGMDFDNATGILWGSVKDGGSNNYLASIDIGTGAVTYVGLSVSGLDALSIAVATIPEPGTLTLVGMGLIGLLTLRRHRK